MTTTRKTHIGATFVRMIPKSRFVCFVLAVFALENMTRTKFFCVINVMMSITHFASTPLWPPFQTPKNGFVQRARRPLWNPAIQKTRLRPGDAPRLPQKALVLQRVHPTQTERRPQKRRIKYHTYLMPNLHPVFPAAIMMQLHQRNREGDLARSKLRHHPRPVISRFPLGNAGVHLRPPLP